MLTVFALQLITNLNKTINWNTWHRITRLRVVVTNLTWGILNFKVSCFTSINLVPGKLSAIKSITGLNFSFCSSTVSAMSVSFDRYTYVNSKSTVYGCRRVKTSRIVSGANAKQNVHKPWEYSRVQISLSNAVDYRYIGIFRSP